MSEGEVQAPRVTADVAAFIAGADLSSLPPAVMDKARQAIADTFACILAGAASELRAPLLAYADEQPGGKCRVLGTAGFASAQMAALLNGSFAAALDYDDLMTPLHPSAVVIAALCSAVAGAKLQGRRFVEAYLLGIEVGAKITRALGHGHSKRGFHATSTLSRFSAFAALARLKALPVEQIETGLSLVASQSGGLLCQLGTMTKPLHSGLAARVAVDAERLSALGITASKAVLETRRGYFEAYGDDLSNAAAIAPSLGQPWAVMEPGSTLKRFASSVAGHRAMAAVLELKAQGLTASNLVSLDCAVAPGALRPMAYPVPQTGFESKFSMPYALAAALLDDRLSIASFETAATRRPEIAALMERIKAWEDPLQAVEDPVSANLSWGYRGYARVTVKLDDGRTLISRVDVPPGAPSHPLSWDDLRLKFLDCANSAGMPAGPATEVFEQIQALDACDDVDALLAAMQVRS